MIFGDIDHSEKNLAVLSKYIKVKPYEKHIRAMMNVYFERASDRVLGKNFSKERISQRKQVKIYQDVLRQLRGTYGKWVNLMGFKVCSDMTIKFHTNISLAFKTDFGPLYGAHSCALARDVYFTAHAFERFEERADPEAYEIARKPVEDYIKAKPTAADVLMASTDMTPGEFSKDGDDYYLNVGSGILVLSAFPEFYIAKTFLTPDMHCGAKEWRTPLVEGRMWSNFMTLRDMFHSETEVIEGPLFDTDLLAILKEKGPMYAEGVDKD